MKVSYCASCAILLSFCACSTSTTTNALPGSNGGQAGNASGASGTEAERLTSGGTTGNSGAHQTETGQFSTGGAITIGGGVGTATTAAGSGGSQSAGGSTIAGSANGDSGGREAGVGGRAAGDTGAIGGATAVIPAVGGGPLGGASPTGGTSAIAGSSATGGKPGCVTANECRNPHTPTCSVACVNGACVTTVSSSLGVAIQSGPRTASPRVGLWGSDGTPYLIYPGTGSIPLGIQIQPLDADGAISASARVLNLPSGVTAVDNVAAALSGNKLGVIWHGAREAVNLVDTALSVTDLNGTAAAPVTLRTAVFQGTYPDHIYNLFLHPNGSDNWATVAMGGTTMYWWLGSVVSTLKPPTDLALSDDNILSSSPASVTGMSRFRPVPQAAAVLNTTLFVTGFDAQWYDGSPSFPMLIMARYDVTNMAARTPTRVALSLNAYPTEDGYQRTPALGKLGNKLAALWTEYSTTNQLLLGRAVFDENGSAVVARTAVVSDLIPKAIVGSPSGAAMLVASRIDNSGSITTHTLVVQRLDSMLGLVGSAYPIHSTSPNEPTDVMAQLAADGRVLVTFRQDYAYHRLLHADLCQ